MVNSNIILNKLTAIESLLEATKQTKPLTSDRSGKVSGLEPIPPLQAHQ
jgi:hypothetical protein